MDIPTKVKQRVISNNYFVLMFNNYLSNVVVYLQCFDPLYSNTVMITQARVNF